MLTATSTQFLILSGKVDYLLNAFNWVVGGIGIVITVVILIIGISQYLYNKRLVKEEAEGLKRDLNEFMKNAIDEKALSLQGFIDESTNSLRREMEFYRESVEADIARNYAIQCDEAKLYAAAFSWWLSAATHYEYVEEVALLTISIKAAKDSLEKIMTGDSKNIKILWEKMTRCQENINKLSNKHPSESKILSDLMVKKAALEEHKQPLPLSA